MNELILLLRADADIQAAFERYEEWQEGRGVIFLRHLDAAFELLRAHPEIAPVFKHGHRRLLVAGFPFGIFYSIEGNRIIVAGVADLRQDPEAILRRLGLG